MSDFAAAARGFAEMDEAALSGPWSWRNAQMDARNALYWALEEAQEAVLAAAAGPAPESRRILARAERAFGDLRGLLVGIPGNLFDTAPREGEWPVRETLRHMLWIERRYMLQTRYAVVRTDADPMRIADTELPPLAQIDGSGDADAVVARLAHARAESNRVLDDVPPAGMTRPTIWVHYTVDVRFRLHRFALHVVEHTIQCEKALADLGWRQTEGRRMLRHFTAALAELDGLGAGAQARALEQTLIERYAQVRTP
ncbi:MAG: DinB family protein [Candidatus Rokuibacteriota bacterium]